MAKYIDADKLTKSINNYRQGAKCALNPIDGYADYYKGKIGACKDIQDFIDSLRQEQQEVDLEKEIETSIRLLNGLHTLEDNNSWYKGRYEELKEFARHFYELGKNSK